MTTGRPTSSPTRRRRRESLLAEPLKGVGRRTRLESSPAQNAGTGGARGLGRLEQLLLRLDGARARDEHELAPADRDAADLHDAGARTALRERVGDGAHEAVSPGGASAVGMSVAIMVSGNKKTFRREGLGRNGL